MVCSVEAILTPDSAKALLRVIGIKSGSPVYDEDIAQEALLRGLVAFGRAGYVSNPQAFFGKIVRDTLYDHWRRRRILYSLDSWSGAELSDAFSLDEYIDRRRQMGPIYKALDFLSEGEHRLIDLFYFQEMSIAEISDIVGKSRSAIKMGLLRGRKRILEFMAEQSPAVD